MGSGYELDEKEEMVQHFVKFGEILDQVEDEATPSIILKFKTRQSAEAAMATGKNYKDRTLSLSWFSQATPGQGVVGGEQFAEEGGEEADDGYTPPQEDYLPPGLQEHEDSLSRERTESETVSETTADIEELHEHLLDEEDDDAENEERSWKRRN